MEIDGRFQQVGQLVRLETNELVIGYKFDLRTNVLSAEKIPNPTAGNSHKFKEYRLTSQSSRSVTMSINPTRVGDEDEE